MNKHSAELLEQHFDTAFAAPDGIRKLRELILTLAMRGQLVPQDPDDQPASELLKEIEAEKQRLVKEGKIKKPKALPPVTEAEKPYALPRGWEWVKLGTLANYTYGKTPPSKNPVYWTAEEGIPWISIADLPTRGYVTETFKAVTAEAVANIFKKKPTPKNSLLMSFKLSIGKTAITKIDAYHNEAIISFIDLEKNIKLWLFWILYPIANTGKSKKAIMGRTLNSESIGNLLIPLPPSVEQHRIVAKIDELMARCDELEKLRTAQQEQRLTVHAAAIQQLLNIAEPGQHQRAQIFLAEHFGELYSVKENVAELRKAILQLAVMGKLVPQDPSDPPASELLKEIEAEKQRLVKEGKIKKPKPLPPVTDEEKPYPLPQGWEWVRLGEITSKITDGDHKTPPRISSGFKLLSAKNVRDGFLDFDNCDYISEQHYQKSRERCLPETGDLLIVSVGGTIGRTSLVSKKSDFALVRSVALIKPLLLNSKYLKYSMDSDLLQSSIHRKKRGGAQPCLYLSEIVLFHFSLPPLSEQNRIVSKIDELMALCDSLDQQIDIATSRQADLLNAVIAQV